MIKEKRILVGGLTHDGLDVPTGYVLRRTGPWFEGWSFGNPIFFFESEFNTDWDGSKKKYRILYILGLKFQWGWLWER